MDPSLRIANEVKNLLENKIEIIDPLVNKDLLTFRSGFLLENTSIQSFVLNGLIVNFDINHIIKDIFDKLALMSDLENIMINNYGMLSELPTNISKLNQIKSLDLSSNAIKNLHSGFYYLENLVLLNISSNKLTEISPNIKELKNLRELRIGNNNMRHIPKEIQYLKNLEILSLYNNQISKLPKELLNLTNLKVLDLQNNLLQKEPKFLKNFKYLEKLNVDGNPFIK